MPDSRSSRSEPLGSTAFKLQQNQEESHAAHRPGNKQAEQDRGTTCQRNSKSFTVKGGEDLPGEPEENSLRWQQDNHETPTTTGGACRGQAHARAGAAGQPCQLT